MTINLISTNAIQSNKPLAKRKMLRLLSSTLPYAALLIPGAAHAASAVNTATVTAPAGSFDSDTANNSATDSDTILAVIAATNDNVGSVNGLTGATAVVNAFTGDTFNGIAASASTTTLAVASGSSVPAGLSFDIVTGNVDVAAGTAAGTYSFDYTICETLNPSNCKTATISVIVVAAPILADPDSVSGVNGATGATGVVDVIAGDRLNGVQVTLAQVNLTVETAAIPASPGAPVPAINLATGLVDVPANTPAGTYAIGYKICERLNPANCSTNMVTVEVAPSSIIATNDTVGSVNGLTGATAVINAFTGDTVNGVAASASNAILALASGSTVPAALSFNTATGSVGVAAGTPVGTYSFDYSICETLNPANCRTATISVAVVAAPIAADPDSVSGVNGATGATGVVDVIAGDTLNAVQLTLAQVNLTVQTPATPASPGAPVPVLNLATGMIDVPANTPAGSYAVTYQICEQLNPASCSTNTVTIEVAPSAIVTNNGSIGSINGASGATAVINALTGNTVNGNSASTSNAILAVASGSTVPPGLTFNTATGDVDVAPGTPAGTYSFDYTICEALNPSNCQTATLTITVVAAAISADADGVSGLNGVTGATDVLDVISGDMLNGAQVTMAQINLSIVTPATPANPGAPVPILNLATGRVDLLAGTPAGTYTIGYQICEQLNPVNCAANIVTVTVAPSTDLAITKTNGRTDVFSGETINYTLTITNNGPDASTGALVRDVPGVGLTCPVSNVVTISGSGAPAGAYTFADLTGAGIVLGTIPNGQSTVVSYSCTVN